MLRNGLIFAATCAVVLVAFVWSENEVAPRFQSCVSHYAASGGNQQRDNKGEIVVRAIASESTCTLQLIDRHNGFFSALAALAVAAFTYTLWRSSQGLLRVTARTVELTSKNFSAEHRPWIAVDAEINQLRFEKGACYIKLAYKLNNTGNSPAGATFVDCRPFVIVPGAASPVNPEKFRKETATKAAKLRRFDGFRGGVIFPGQGRDGLCDLVITSDDFKAAPPGTPVTVFILVGADYCFTFADGSHQTVATFTVGPFSIPYTDAIMTLAELQRFSLGDYAD